MTKRQGYEQDTSDDSLMLSNILRAVRRWWWLLLLATAVAGGVAIRSAAHTPRNYRTETTILVGRIAQQANPDANAFTLLDRLTSFYANVATREPVLDAAAKSVSPPTTAAAIAPRVQARAITGTQFIEVTYLDPDPRRAADIANAIASALIKQSPTPDGSQTAEQAKFTQGQLLDLQTKITDSQTQIKKLEDDIAQSSSAAEIADARSKEKELQAEVDGWRTNYTNLLIQAQPSALNFLSIVEPAAIPSSPVSASRTLVIGMGGILGLGLAFGGVLLIEYLDDTLRRPQDVKQQTHLPLLATMTRKRRQRWESAPFSALRNILLDTTPAVPLRLLVTAPRRHNGVTYTAVGLAEAFTRAGRRVVLVDGNFVAPTVHASFDVPMRPGFADVIADAASAGRALTTSPRGIKNLIVLPTGDTSGSDDALGRPGLSAALDAIVAEACPDVLIVDGGALTDATRTSRLLAHYLSHTVLVVTGQTRGRTLRSIATTLTTSGTEVVGVVFNQSVRSRRTSNPSKGRARRLPKAVMARMLNYFGFGLSKKNPKATGYAYPPGSLASMAPPPGSTDILVED
jgi:succinoglycan biosynthesis transport protein ExoP